MEDVPQQGERDPAGRGPRSVRTHLLAIVAAATLTIVGGAAYAYSWSWDEAQDDALGRMTYQAQRAAGGITDGLTVARRTVTGLAAQPGLAGAFVNPSGCTLTIDGAGAFPVVRLDVVRADGVVACTSGDFPQPRDAAVHAEAGWLASALTSRTPAVGADAFDDVSEQRAVAVTAPVPSLDGSGAAAGVAVIFLFHEPAAAAMTQAFGGSSDVSFTVLDLQDREVLSASDGADPSGARGQIRDSGVQGRLTTGDGEHFLFSSAPVAELDWRVLAALPYDRAFGEIKGALVRQGALGALALVVLLSGAGLLHRRIVRPVNDVVRAALEASRNPSAGRVREAGTAETVSLARAFNDLLDIRSGHEAQLDYQATHDVLTGLPNTSLLVLPIEKAIRAGRQVAVIAVAVDQYRSVNDAVGHHAADRLLREVAERLSASMRPGDSLARSGSDQFVLLVQDVEVEQARDVVARTQGVLQEPFPGPLGEVRVTVTAGVSTGGSGSSASQLLREADTALHEAKSSSAAVHVFDPDLQSRATAQLTLLRELDHALEHDELIVHYQPLVELATGSIVGAEALVRWLHPVRGLVPPSDFIPVAEQTGQIAAIGDLVLRRACEQAVRWAISGRPLTVSVNVAAAQLRDGDFPRTVERALAASGLPPQRLCLEITESSLMTGSARITQDLAELRRLGVQVALDDFGTGYSSLAYLQQLPCDELKIDRSFVSRLDADGRERHLVAAIVGMAHALGLTVVAEGIETEQQRLLLRGMGCQQAQGYLFSPPVSAARFDALLTGAQQNVVERRTRRRGQHVLAAGGR